MTLMTVFIVQFSILRSSRSLTSVYLDDDNWLIIRSETGIKVWGGGGGTHTASGRAGEGAGAQHYNGPSGPRLGMQHATIDCIEEYRIMAIMARNAPSDCLVFTVHSQTVLLISSDSDTIHYTNHS